MVRYFPQCRCEFIRTRRAYFNTVVRINYIASIGIYRLLRLVVVFFFLAVVVFLSKKQEYNLGGW